MGMFLGKEDDEPQCAHNVPGCNCRGQHAPDRNRDYDKCAHSPSCQCHERCLDEGEVLEAAAGRVLAAIAFMRKDGNGVTHSQEMAVLAAVRGEEAA